MFVKILTYDGTYMNYFNYALPAIEKKDYNENRKREMLENPAPVSKQENQKLKALPHAVLRFDFSFARYC
jgi:hypothetical protein